MEIRLLLYGGAERAGEVGGTPTLGKCRKHTAIFIRLNGYPAKRALGQRAAVDLELGALDGEK